MGRQKNTVPKRLSGASLRPWFAGASQMGILILMALALQLPASLSRDSLPGAWPSSDLVVSHWPMALQIQRTVAQQHQLPLWDPYFGGGLPLGGDPLAALFYPPTHLLHFLSLRDYFFVLITGHLVFAGLGMLLLARRAAGLPTIPALVAALSYMATPRLAAHLGAGHITILQTVSWFPWLALAGWATLQAPLRWGPALALCIGLILLAGHPQMAYYGLLMLGAIIAWLLVQRWLREGRRFLAPVLTGLAAAGILGLALAAIHLGLLADLTSHSTRDQALHPQEHYPLLDFLHALVIAPAPGWGIWEGMLTPGLCVLALALLAIVARWKQSWPLLLGIILVAGLAMGQSSLPYLLAVHVLPGLDRFRALARIWFLGLLGCALLAGMGSAWIGERLRPLTCYGEVISGALIALLVGGTLIATDSGYTHVGPVSAITTPSPVATFAAHLAGNGYVYDLQQNISQLTAVEMQTRLASGSDPLLNAAYVSYMDRAGGYYGQGYQLRVPYDAPGVEPDARLLGLMHISVVVSRRPLSNPLLVKVTKIDGISIYKNLADAGPGYLVEPASNGNPPALAQLQVQSAEVHLLQQGEGNWSFQVTSMNSGYFVIATPTFPGWHAVVDDQPAAISMIAGVLPAIRLAPGTHHVSYVYMPRSLWFGGALSLLSLLVILSWLVGGRLLERRWPAPQMTVPHPPLSAEQDAVQPGDALTEDRSHAEIPSGERGRSHRS
jgi:hypothetical protein